jgi:hypothetical protein
LLTRYTFDYFNQMITAHIDLWLKLKAVFIRSQS